MSGSKRFHGGPDSVLSWITAMACCLLYFIVFGTNRANGLLFVGMLAEDPETSREELSWPFNLIGSAIVVGGPLSGFLSTRYSNRSIAVVGSIIFALGSVVCFFSTDVLFVSAFYGIVRGIGLSLATTSVPGLINNSFDRHRATAMGIAMSGTPIGGFAFPMVVQLCMDTYGLKGTFLLMGGISLHAAIGAVAIFEYSSTPKNKVCSEKPLEQGPPMKAQPDLANKQVSLVHFRSNHKQNKVLEEGVCNQAFEGDTAQGSISVIKLQKDGVACSLPKNGHSITASKLQEANFPNSLSEKTRTTPLPISENHEQLGDKFANGHSDVFSKVKVGETQIIGVKATTIPDEIIIKVNDPEPTIAQRLKVIFSSHGFYLVTMTNFAIAFFLSSYMLLIVDYAVDKNIERHNGVHLLTVCSIGEIIGRLFLGWITDRNYVTRPTYLFVTLMITAIMITMLGLFQDFTILLVCAAIFGASQGTALNVANVMYVEYVRKEDLQLAFSFTRSIVGLSFIPRSPLIGAFRDNLGTYDYLFYLMSGLFYLSAISWFVEGLVQKRKKAVGITTIN